MANECPFRVGDWVIYKPSLRGYGLIDGERMIRSKRYRVEAIQEKVYVVVEGYRHPGGGLYWTEFELAERVGVTETGVAANKTEERK